VSVFCSDPIKNAYGTVPTELFGYEQVAADLLEVHRGDTESQ
jgi:hypothetical protein